MKLINKLGLGLITLVGAASSSFAAVTYDAVNGFGGTFDLEPYYSAVGIVITAIAVVAAIKLALGQFKRV